jgi:peptidoglycan/xylan/chitin deacetylase (PgdA/CDA1 family)
VATPTPAGAAWVPNCDEANLRTAPNTSATIKVRLGLRSTLTVNGSVKGSPWNVVCPTSKSGTSWHVISAIDGVPVSSRYGVSVLYAAAGLFVPAGAPSLLINNGNRIDDGVALTFDMGGRIGDSLAIMNYLVSRAVQATIFPTGEIVDSKATSAGRQVLGIVQAHPELFTLGNHSYSHPYFTQISAAQMADQLQRTAAAFAKHTGQDPKPFFRPPYGSSNSAVLAGVGAAGYRLSIKWDIDTIDWRPINNPGGPAGPTADQIVSKVLTNAKRGSIVLMHLGGFETYEALPRIIDGLKAKGHALVNLDAMLGP